VTVLLTGAGGFVGSHVLEALITQTGTRIVCTDSFQHNGSVDRMVDAMGGGTRQRVTILTHDLVAPFSPSERARIADVSDIIHVASLCQVDQSIQMPAAFISNNIALTLNVLELARSLRARVIHMSTDEVFGEGSLTHRPSSPYAASKAAQEDICHAYRQTYMVPIQLIISANLFGERQSQLAFVPRIIRAALQGERLAVHVTNGTPGTRWYTYVRNVADYIVAVLQGMRYDMPRHYLAGQLLLDNLNLVQLIGELVGKTPDVELVEAELQRPGYDRSYMTLPENIRWQPKVLVSEGLERTVRWALKNPEWLEG